MKVSKFKYILMLSALLKLLGCGGKTSEEESTDSGRIMQEFRQNIEANRILTKQMLDTTADEKIEDMIIANINSKLDRDLSNDKDVLPTLSKERQAIYYIYLVEMEVNNGGFHQFYLNKFVNNDGSYMFEKPVEAYMIIGAPKFAGLVKRANQLFKSNERNFVDSEGLFEDLDQEFYDTYKQENIFDIRVKFIRNNIVAFVDE